MNPPAPVDAMGEREKSKKKKDSLLYIHWEHYSLHAQQVNSNVFKYFLLNVWCTQSFKVCCVCCLQTNKHCELLPTSDNILNTVEEFTHSRIRCENKKRKKKEKWKKKDFKFNDFYTRVLAEHTVNKYMRNWLIDWLLSNDEFFSFSSVVIVVHSFNVFSIYEDVSFLWFGKHQKQNILKSF